jgi:hypothetical protein
MAILDWFRSSTGALFNETELQADPISTEAARAQGSASSLATELVRQPAAEARKKGTPFDRMFVLIISFVLNLNFQYQPEANSAYS